MVNATIDRGEISPRVVRRRGAKSSRRLGMPELVYLTLRSKLAGVLSSSSRRRVYQEIKRELQRDQPALLGGSYARQTALRAAPVQLDIVTVNYDEALDHVLERVRLLTAAGEYVTSDPDIRGGEPVVRGTRVPVYRLAELAAQGVSEADLLEDHPSVSRDALRGAITYARTRPRRGRPKQGPWHEGGTEKLTKSAESSKRRRAA